MSHAGMRVLLVGSLSGELGKAARIAMSRGAKLDQVDTVDGAIARLRADARVDLVLCDICNDVGALVRGLAAERMAVSVVACGTDTDCVDLSDWTSCSFGCGVITNTTGAGVLSDALQDQGATTCAQFFADQCVTTSAPCTSTSATDSAAQCIAGQCVVGLPAAWVSFGIETDNGGPGVDSEPVQCNGTSCTLWRVLADGTLNITAPSGQRVTKMSAADLATADGILRDPEERQLELNGWSLCNTFSGPQHVTMDVDRYNVGTGADVSGCIASGPASSGPARLYTLLQSY